jgi:hypothetical protein
MRQLCNAEKSGKLPHLFAERRPGSWLKNRATAMEKAGKTGTGTEAVMAVQS